MTTTYPELHLKRGSERSLRNGHPWVYSGAVQRAPRLPAGSIVDVLDHHGRFLLRGSYNGRAAIRVRALTWDRDEHITPAFFSRLVHTAMDLRTRAGLPACTNAMRLIHGESDGLPGLIADVYAGYLVVQFHTAGMEHFRSQIIDALWEQGAFSGIYERSDVGTRRAEGLRDRPTGLLRGTSPPSMIPIHEHGVSLFVDVYQGQKTGLFLDQRPNRFMVQQVSRGKDVLNCFAYTAGFSAHALYGGARRTLDVDIATNGVPTARQNLITNCAPGASWDYAVANVFPFVEELAERGPRFDLVVVDPPSLLRKQHQLKHAMGVYTKLNRNALRLVRSGGLLVSASCSARVNMEDFFQIVRRAAAGAGVRLRINSYQLQAPDHPVDPAFPEGRYLKCICARVLRP